MMTNDVLVVESRKIMLSLKMGSLESHLMLTKEFFFLARKTSFLRLIRNAQSNLSKTYLVFCSFFFNLCVKEVQYEKTEHTIVLYFTKVQTHFFLKNNIEIKI